MSKKIINVSNFKKIYLYLEDNKYQKKKINKTITIHKNNQDLFAYFITFNKITHLEFISHNISTISINKPYRINKNNYNLIISILNTLGYKEYTTYQINSLIYFKNNVNITLEEINNKKYLIIESSNIEELSNIMSEIL